MRLFVLVSAGPVSCSLWSTITNYRTNHHFGLGQEEGVLGGGLFANVYLLSLLSNYILSSLRSYPNRPSGPILPGPPRRAARFLCFQCAKSNSASLLAREVSYISVCIFSDKRHLIDALRVSTRTLETERNISVSLPTNGCAIIYLKGTNRHARIDSLAAYSLRVVFFTRPNCFVGSRDVLANGSPLCRNSLQFEIRSKGSLGSAISFGSSRLGICIRIGKCKAARCKGSNNRPSVHLRGVPYHIFFSGQVYPREHACRPRIKERNTRSVCIKGLYAFQLSKGRPTRVTLCDKTNARPFCAISITSFLGERPRISVAGRRTRLSVQVRFEREGTGIAVAIPR